MQNNKGWVRTGGVQIAKQERVGQDRMYADCGTGKEGSGQEVCKLRNRNGGVRTGGVRIAEQERRGQGRRCVDCGTGKGGSGQEVLERKLI